MGEFLYAYHSQEGVEDAQRNRHMANIHPAQAERRTMDGDTITEQRVLTSGRIVTVGDLHTREQGLRPDYVLFIRRNIPIAVISPKTVTRYRLSGWGAGEGQFVYSG
jgi:hypothetical protein